MQSLRVHLSPLYLFSQVWAVPTSPGLHAILVLLACNVKISCQLQKKKVQDIWPASGLACWLQS